MPDLSKLQPATQAIHAGNSIGAASGAVVPPMVLSTTFERGHDGLSYPGGFVYSRYDAPNRQSLETKLALLENGTEAVCFASGMAAIAAVLHALGPGCHVVVPDDVYFGVRGIVEKLYAPWGMTFSYVDMTDLPTVEAAIQKNTRLIWIETPSNPELKITDIEAIVKIAQPRGILTGCDNTWATPYFQQPLALGVDVSMHSTTKYLGGHSDLLGGVLIFREQTPLSDFARTYQKAGGAVPSAFDCWLLGRSLATFAARMPIHASNAAQLAAYLSAHPRVERVLYPGLVADPYHQVAKKQMKGGFGGMLSVLLKGDQANALAVATKLQLFKHATSLGGVESLIEHRKSVEGPTSLTPDNLLRISVGIEAIEDLLADFGQALG